MRMKPQVVFAAMMAASFVVAGGPETASGAEKAAVTGEKRPAPARARDIERGRYLVVLGGCNDCHTPDYAPSGGNVPEARWLIGDKVLGYRGPWGTTYAPNLRHTVASMNEDAWVAYAKALRTRPPMPWFNLNRMSDGDLRAMYRFIGQVGPPGEPVAAFVPPDREPKPPFVQWPMSAK
jgi:mono/diheme cytochrome c family protein